MFWKCFIAMYIARVSDPIAQHLDSTSCNLCKKRQWLRRTVTYFCFATVRYSLADYWCSYRCFRARNRTIYRASLDIFSVVLASKVMENLRDFFIKNTVGDCKSSELFDGNRQRWPNITKCGLNPSMFVTPCIRRWQRHCPHADECIHCQRVDKRNR